MKIEKLVKPASVEEAFRFVTTEKEAVLFAGGVWNRLSLKQVGTAVLLDGLGLEKIVANEKTVEIGAMATLDACARDAVVGNMYGGMISRACRNVMGINVQDLATIGGSVMGGYAFSDVLTALLAADARLVFHRHEPMKLADYLARKTNFRDILVAVSLPRRNGRGIFRKFARTRLDFSYLNLAVTNVNGLYAIAVGARPGIARLATNAMDRLNEIHPVGVYDLERAASEAVAELDFGTNARASEEYRRALAKVHVLRALKEVTFDENPR
jgi:CO/xanthine dehydrogenase FAD-binding subunit